MHFKARNGGGDTMKKKNPHVGSSLNDFLQEEGILEEACATALKEATDSWARPSHQDGVKKMAQSPSLPSEEV
jgi:hypothetical protein